MWNPWPGGRAAIIVRNKIEETYKGFQPVATNNQMELLAVIQALLVVMLKYNPGFLLEEVTTWFGGSGSWLFEQPSLESKFVQIENVIELSTDSEYVRKGVTERLPTRVKRGRRRSKGGKLIENTALRQQVHALLPYFPYLTRKRVKGHAGDRLNEMVDELARAAALKGGEA